MRWPTLAHSRRWQARHGQIGVGNLYRGRYRSHPVEGNGQLLTAFRYIQRNPAGCSHLCHSPCRTTGRRG